MQQPSENWDIEIKPGAGLMNFNLRELWQYRDLLLLLVKRDFVAFYKQTVLGPVWFFVQPVLTSVMYLVIFSGIAGLSTDALPPVLFYLSGVTCWNYFSESLTKTSDTFIANASIFGKVYFPRLIIPLSIVLSNLIRLGIQLVLFMLVWLYYFSIGSPVSPTIHLLLLPLLVLLMAMLGLGAGILFSALTTKYRDLRFLLTFGIQLLMFATPVILPLSAMSSQYRWIIQLNPVSPIIETFRYGFMGAGQFSWAWLGYSFVFATVLVALGMIIFNRVEKSFMDTV